MNLASDMERRATEAPERVGLIFEDGSTFNFREINKLSSKTANLLKSHGVQKGDRVAVYLQNSPTFVMVILGLWKIGAILVPINIMYQEQELRHALKTTEVSAIITHTDSIDRILTVKDFIKTFIKTFILCGGNAKNVIPETIDYDTEIMRQEEDYPSFEPEDKDVAAILFTGGTTGEPKAVITTHNGWYKTLSDLAHAHTGHRGPYVIAEPNIPPNILALPLFHSGGQQSLLFAYHIGRSVLLMERFRVNKYEDLVRRYKVRSLVLMPTMIHDIVNYEGKIDFSLVNTVTSIGQELNPLLRKRFEEKFKIPILMNYGSTEVGHVAGWSMKDMKNGLWKPGSVGKIYPGVEVEVRDENDRRLPSGEVGEICIKSKVTMEGYAGKKEESKALIKDGWIYMGDIGYLDNENVLFLIGRKREMIKCGGFQVWPMEIEEVLIKHPKIKDVAVIGVADERLGEIPKAFIVLRQKSDAQGKEKLEKEIVEFCREKMAHFKVIRQVEFIDELPRGDTGKVLKDKLRKK